VNIRQDSNTQNHPSVLIPSAGQHMGQTEPVNGKPAPDRLLYTTD